MSGPRWTAIGSDPLHFLKALRRRRLLIWCLAPGCVVAAALNEAVRWGTVGLNRWAGLDLPVLDVGPPFLLIALITLARRWKPEQTAAFADRRLDFQDRFTSLVDFAGRGDIDPSLAAAQGEEVRAALGDRSPGALLPLRPALFVAPLLLLASLGYPLLLPSSGVGVVQMMFRDAPPPGGGGTRSDGTLDTAGDAPRHQQNPAGPDRPAKDREVASSSRTAQQSPPPPNRGAGELDAEGPVPPLDGPQRQMRSPDGVLVSNRVGKELTRVVSPLFRESQPRPEPEQAGGTVAFRLLPKSGATGDGEGTGGGENPEAATVDLDAVPEGYRHLVRTYFTLLNEGAGAHRQDQAGTAPDSSRKD